MKSAQIFLTPNEGKKLIADALASLPMVEEALEEHTVVVVMGTTNAYLANALLESIGEKEIDMAPFHRGITKPASVPLKAEAGKVLSRDWRMSVGVTPILMTYPLLSNSPAENAPAGMPSFS